MSGVNRTKAQDRRSRREKRQEIGETSLINDHKYKDDWNFDWFKPLGLQMDCIESFKKNTYTVVDGPSGTGKTSTALWWALQQIKAGYFRNLIFIKNPTEVGDDQIGYLSGSESDKLVAHMDSTRRIFENFMSKNKLENDLRNEKIRLTIPNFLLGATLDYAIVLLDETQLMSPSTVKLLTERCGKDTKYIIMGDDSQRYAVKKRGDGFQDYVDRVTISHQGIKWSKYEPMVGYVKMSSDDNRRSDGSAFINKLYADF